MAEPERRRRRPPVSCTLCRRRKLRCSRESPCSNCIKSRSGNCVYENFISHAQPGVELGLGPAYSESHYSAPTTSISSTATGVTAPNHTSQSSPKAASSTAGSTPTSYSSQEVESLRNRIRQLEEQLSKTNLTPSQPPADSNIEAINSRISGTFYIHHENNLTGQPRAISRSVTHKTRVFGQSHWITGFSLVRDIIGIFEPHVRDESSRISVLMQKSKSLARAIKDRRSPPWPSLPVVDLPSKDIADELVDRYFRTVEPIYRILHIPTFRREYAAQWVSTSNEPNTAFLVQLKLVLAIGATTYDELFSLKPSALKWVYEAQTWISEPGFKHRLNLQYLQTNILLLIAREFVDVGPDLVWIAAGTLLRTAIYMGLHKDPKRLPTMSTFAAEMRRRLWNTILELSTQLSLTSGGPPFVSLDGFDTEPPGNFDDEQITADDPVPKPEAEFTQTSIAIALRKTFAARLAITKFLNDHSSRGTYGETLRLDAGLRTAYKSVLRLLQGYKSGSGLRPSETEVDMVSLLMNRYILSLHNPYFSSAMQEAAYAFSRKVIIETSIKVWRAMYPSTTTTLQPSRNVPSSNYHDLPRLAICASGFFRIITLQASILIAMELMAQLQEEEILGPGIVRQDLLTIMEEAKTWSWRTIEAGETSIKGYFLASLLAAHIEGRIQGLGKEELPSFLIKVIEEAEEKCIPKLEEMLARYQTESATKELEQPHMNTEPQSLGDWDFSMSDALFDFSNPDPINWAFGETTQDPLTL
ncbi:putative C6 transcription factor [Annulohypoxylon truncatum]|uniref:putative C6 transcription factor n=1 Tax=Annulohypoxylon truncatum TaxID=327061 RepID=UPI002008449A|nr:putative C6 transcription factor [Annulohypoxylon truncatum]KAI1210768.1 putative C6 transcription factor [Annulohypoxylon truncatum]